MNLQKLLFIKTNYSLHLVYLSYTQSTVVYRCSCFPVIWPYHNKPSCHQRLPIMCAYVRACVRACVRTCALAYDQFCRSLDN